MSASATPALSVSASEDMLVVKRNGEREIVAFDKILARLKTLGQASKITGVNYTTLVIKIIDQLYDGIPTTKIDELTAQQCAMMAVQHQRKQAPGPAVASRTRPPQIQSCVDCHDIAKQFDSVPHAQTLRSPGVSVLQKQFSGQSFKAGD